MLRSLALLGALALAAPATAQTYQFVPLGAGCGPQLTAQWRPIGGGNQQLVLTVTGLYPREFGVMTWGIDDVQFNLPGTNCPVYTTFIWGHTFQTDNAGSYTWQRSWPSSFIGFFNIQMGGWTFDPAFQVMTSNAIRAQHM